MPVRSKDRLKVVMASAAAMFIAAASASVWAQSANSIALRGAASQGPDDQDQSLSQQDQESDEQPSDEPPDEAQEGAAQLRGIDAPDFGATQPADNDSSLQAQGAPAANPIDSEEPQYGLPAPISATSNYINYGKKKPKKPKFYRLHKIQPPGLPPLPPLTSYKTAPETLPRGSNPPLQDPNNPGPTVAVVPLLPRPLRPKPDPTPFAPAGVDVGSLRLVPYVETDTGYDTNPNFLSDDVVGSPYVHGEVGLSAQSLWSQHSLTATLRGGYYDYFRVPAADRPEAAGTITGRIDVLRDTQINLVSTFDVETQQPGSPILAIPNSVFITNRPLIVTYGQSAGITQEFNRLSVSLKGAFARDSFGNATQSNGTILPLALDDYNDYGIEGRASYELTPSLIPYVDVLGDRRSYDHLTDVYGFERSSNGVAEKLGATLEFTRLLTGDIAAGYADRVYADPRLPNLAAPTIDANLIYAITPLTTATLTASTYLSETTLAYASGTISRSVSLNLSQALRPDLLLSGTVGYANNVYDGTSITEQIYSGMLRADYNLSRYVVLTGSIAHQRFQSSAPNSNYTDDVFLLGVRLQD